MNSGTKPARGVTRDDVAKLAGVSSAVVSYVINDGPRPVAKATRLRVLDAIDKLGYRPNAAARSLITGRSDLIGLIVPDIQNPYFAALAKAVEIEARAQGVNVVLGQGVTVDMAGLVEALSGHLVAGIITAALPEPQAIEILRRNRIKVVRLSLVPGSFDASLTVPDYYGGAKVVVEHLISHGHKRIGLIMGSDYPHRGAGWVDGREIGWRAALTEAGLPADAVVYTHWSPEAGREAIGQLLAAHPDVTACFTSSDQQAIGVLAGLAARGRKVPDDLALASFDGSPQAEFTIPPLTTASVSMAEMARSAVGQLLAPGSERTEETLPVELVIRRSCGCSEVAVSAGAGEGIGESAQVAQRAPDDQIDGDGAQ